MTVESPRFGVSPGVRGSTLVGPGVAVVSRGGLLVCDHGEFSFEQLGGYLFADDVQAVFVRVNSEVTVTAYLTGGGLARKG